ncbi:hypothetical protein BTS2_0511 [Bacillus sp. TS-2]|nr:hypothetical protein BTS2_0511 [Bacillus sp. TS-2]
MQITFKKLNLENYKSHRNLEVEFGDLLKITGDNAKGKSSIIESITWLLYGNDITGSKLDPSPVTYEAKETTVSLLLDADEKLLKLTRELKSGKTKYYINDVPSKAKEFDAAVATLGDKPFFLSLFNPHYFYTLNWTEQRKMLMQYVSAPTNKQVLNEMSRTEEEQKVKDIVLNPQAKALQEALKKNKLDDLEKLNKDVKNKMDKQHIAAESKTDTLQQQLDSFDGFVVDIDSLETKEKEIRKQIEEADKKPAEAYKHNQEISSLKSQLLLIQDEIDFSRKKFIQLKDTPLNDSCPTCKRELDDTSIEAVKEDKQKQLNEHRVSHQKLLDKKASLKAELEGKEEIDATDELNKVRELEVQLHDVIDKKGNYKRYTTLKAQVEEAKQAEQETLKKLNDSIFMLDAIKTFRATEAAIQGAKVQALFTTLSVRLFEELKTTGELKPAFVIQMDDKDYNKLSLSETIKAGLELREVLSEQSGVIAPCFVDNAESITQFKGPTGQLITSRVVAGQGLEVVAE